MLHTYICITTMMMNSVLGCTSKLEGKRMCFCGWFILVQGEIPSSWISLLNPFSQTSFYQFL